MNFYIPFSLKDGDHSIYDLITSIVGAEGMAPTRSCAFNGIEMPRSSPALFTGIHPLNPFKDRLLVYDRLPLLSANGKFTVAHENAAYICIDSDSVKLPTERALRKVEGASIPGLTVYETDQAVFFSNPSNVSVMFVSPQMYDKCQGCRAGINVKNEKAFGYGVVSQIDEEKAMTVSDEYVDSLSDEGLFAPVSDGAYYPTWRTEALQGAALCYKLVKQCTGVPGGTVRTDSGEGDWKRIVQFTEWLGSLRYVEESWSGQKQLSDIVNLLKTLPSFVKRPCYLEYSRTDDFDFYDPIHRKLIERFVEVAVSLKMKCWNWADNECRASSLKMKCWNWADNECRASLTESVMNLCIDPVTKEIFKDKPEEANTRIVAMSRLMEMVKRRFREPNTYMEFDEGKLNSVFVRAFYRFLSSEGRIDRIQEYLGVESRLELQIREMIAAMYGAFKGYAQISVKRLGAINEPPPPPPPPSPKPETSMMKRVLQILESLIHEGIVPKSKQKQRSKLENDLREAVQEAGENRKRFLDKLSERKWSKKCIKVFREELNSEDRLI